MPSDIEREKRALTSLRGVSIGDAFGQCYFVHPEVAEARIAQRIVVAGEWLYTDDTMMALSVFETLRRFDAIDQQALAESLVRRYDPTRGYGAAMHQVFERIGAGEPWQTVAGSLFGGTGSYGNGSAMRVAPLGAYFADALPCAIREAERSAVVTHAHPEAVAGAIAVAVAAAMAANHHDIPPTEFLDQVWQQTPESEVRSGIRRACGLRAGIAPQHAAAMLGNGSQLSCPDTVPFTLWCAATFLANYEEALWATVSALGDRDTTCAIVGGIVACSAPDTIPPAWIDATETLPLWALCDLG